MIDGFSMPDGKNIFGCNGKNPRIRKSGEDGYLLVMKNGEDKSSENTYVQIFLTHEEVRRLKEEV